MEQAKDRRSEKLPVMQPGEYCLKYDLSLREGAGLNYPKKYETGMSGRLTAPPGMLPRGSRVEILEVKYLSLSVWGRTKDGWICIYMSGTAYAELIKVNE